MIIDSSNISDTVNNVFFFIVAIAVFFLALITFLMILFVFKYNKNKNKEPADISGNTVLEIVWTVIPTLLVLAMFYYGWIGYKIQRDVPEDAMIIQAYGRMWSWAFEYQNRVQSDTLYVPINRSIKLMLSSQDVLHSFFIPAFRVKHDVLPGATENYLWFKPSELGSYDVFCSEYCGQQHSYMRTRVVVMSEKNFQDWLITEEKELMKPDSLSLLNKESKISDGINLVIKRGCLTCHSTDGSPLKSPTFKGIFGRKQIVLTKNNEREIVIDEEYLKKSIINPKADIVKGYKATMPSQEKISTEEEIEKMVAFLKELK